jgi:hypothetical protein
VLQLQQLLTGHRVPGPGGAIAPGRGQYLAVGAECHAGYGVSVLELPSCSPVTVSQSRAVVPSCPTRGPRTTRLSKRDFYSVALDGSVGVSTTAQLRKQLRLRSDAPDDEVERIRATMLPTADTFDVDHHQHLPSIAETLEGMTDP